MSSPHTDEAVRVLDFTKHKDLEALINLCRLFESNQLPKHSLPDTTTEFFKVLSERHYQKEKFGEQDHTDDKWLRVLMEEIGEAAQLMNDHSDNTSTIDPKLRIEYLIRLQDEVIDSATVLVAWSEKLSARIRQIKAQMAPLQ